MHRISYFWLSPLACNFLKLMSISKRNITLKNHSMKWHLNFLGKRAKLWIWLPSQHRRHWPLSLSPPGPTQTHTPGHAAFPLLPSAQGTTQLSSWNFGTHANIIISVPENFINMWFNCNLFSEKTTRDNKWNRTLIKKTERENENLSFLLLHHRPGAAGNV